MSKSTGAVQDGLVLRLSLPASGDIAGVGPDVAAKLGEQLGLDAAAAAQLGKALPDLVRTLAASGTNDVSFEFHKQPGELAIHARCDDRSSDVRVPLAG